MAEGAQRQDQNGWRNDGQESEEISTASRNGRPPEQWCVLLCTINAIVIDHRLPTEKLDKTAPIMVKQGKQSSYRGKHHASNDVDCSMDDPINVLARIEKEEELMQGRFDAFCMISITVH